MQQKYPVAIAGMGGVGKTELATQYARRYENQYGGITWFKSRSNLTGDILQFFSLEFGFEIPQKQGDRLLNLKEQVAWCWSKYPESNLPILIVFDDVTDLANLREVIPKYHRFRVLVTTRLRHLDPNLISEIFLDVLLPEKEPGQALELLKRLLGEQDKRVGKQPEAANAICEFLEYLPLGIELVGGYLVKEAELSLTEMGERLQAQKLADSALQTRETLNSTQLGVKAAFALTWNELDSVTQQVGRFLSLFAPQSILWDLVIWVAISGGENHPSSNLSPTGGEALTPPFPRREGGLGGLGLSADEINTAKNQLYARNLLQQVEDSEGYYKIHALVRWFLEEQLANAGEMRSVLETTFATAMITVAQSLPQSVTSEDIERVKDVIPHLEDLGQRIITEVNRAKEQQINSPASVPNDQVIWVFEGVARFYEGQGLYQLAEPWQKECVNVCQALFTGDHPDVATSLNNLAGLYYIQGQYNQAEHLYTEALAMRKRLFIGDYPAVATSLNNLAGLYYIQGRYNQAEPLYTEALAMRKHLFTGDLTGDHPDVATSLNNLAGLYYIQGRYSQAEPLYTEALAMRTHLFTGDLTGDHPDVATSLNNLAGLYYIQGRYSQAEPLYTKALAMRKRLFTSEHPDVATSLNNLAGLYYIQGRYSQAEPLYTKALAMRKRLFTSDHPDVAQSLDNLAFLYYSQGRYNQTEPLYTEALAMRKRLFTGDHPDVTQSLNNIALLYNNQGRYSQAEPLYTEALAMSKRLFTSDHPDVALSLDNLAFLYYSQGRYNQAEPLYTEALAMRKRLFTGDHPDVAQSLNNIALLYNNQGRYSQAEPLYTEALAMRKRLFTDDHPDVAQSLNNIALLYNNQGRYNQAEPLYTEALAMYERVLGVNHPNTVAVRENLAKMREQLTRPGIWKQLVKFFWS